MNLVTDRLSIDSRIRQCQELSFALVRRMVLVMKQADPWKILHLEKV